MNSKVLSIAQVIEDKRQIIKWVIYSLLLINFVLYFRDDWQIALHTMRNGGTFLDWTGAFATTIDELAWFMLLLLLELETYVLSDEALQGKITRIMHGIRILCFIFIAHTLYGYGTYVSEVTQDIPVTDVSSLCQLADKDISFAKNLEYTLLDQTNCAGLSAASQFFYIDPNNFLIVTDTEGLAVERHLAWLDLIEAFVWLCILVTIELMVRLQDRGITKGRLVRGTYTSKAILYSILWFAIGYWIYKGHYYFAWDELLWIMGFVAIELNVSEWRDEIDEAEATLVAT
jgi:hypothetical protein